MRYELQCPVCPPGRLLRGPESGLCINMTCDACGAWFNVVRLPDGYRIVGKRGPDGSYMDADWEPVALVAAEEGA